MAPTAPSTRRNLRITPPPGPADHREADTIKKTRFFDALDREYGLGDVTAVKCVTWCIHVT